MGLRLPPDTRADVFEEILRLLRTDSTLRQAGLEIQTRGESRGASRPEFGRTRNPRLRIFPIMGGTRWDSEMSQITPLTVAIEVELEGGNDPELIRLWGAIERAFYPREPQERHRIQRALCAKGAVTGLVEFPEPIADPSRNAEDGGHFIALGALKIDVRRDMNI